MAYKNRRQIKGQTQNGGKAEAHKVDPAIATWRAKYEKAKAAYTPTLDKMKLAENLYDQTGIVTGPKKNAQKAEVTQGLAYELVETEIDNTVLQPKVIALHEEDNELARKLEAFIRGVLTRLPIEEINDRNERDTYIHGISYMTVSWDYLGGLHQTLGDVDIKGIGGKAVIPQPGRETLAECEYFFVDFTETREGLRRTYGKTVEMAETASADQERDSEEHSDDDMLLCHTAYYKSDDGIVGKFSWAADTVLEDYKDYLCKQRRVCSDCGERFGDDHCPVCGGEKWKLQPVDYEDITLPVETSGGIVGAEARIPVYKIRQYPVVARKNISKSGAFAGTSDVLTIKHQQDSVNMLNTKMREKVLKGGSYVTLPKGVNIETTDRELKIIRLNTPAEKALIDVLTVQPDINKDIAEIERQKQTAKDTLGITDSYQGKYDASATSGTAKQTSVNQAAGRLESKRVLKHAAAANVFRLIFEHWLAFADDPACVKLHDANGDGYGELSKWEFVKQDANGEWYWNDEFLFKVDTQSLTPADRAQLQQRAQEQLASGAFGDPSNVDTRIRFWRYMAELHYPTAETILAMMEREKAEMERAQAAAQQEQLMSAQQAAELSRQQLIAESNGGMIL